MFESLDRFNLLVDVAEANRLRLLLVSCHCVGRNARGVGGVLVVDCVFDTDDEMALGVGLSVA